MILHDNAKFRNTIGNWFDLECFRELKRALKVNQNINVFMALFCGSCGRRQYILWMSIHLSDMHLGGYYLAKFVLFFILFSTLTQMIFWDKWELIKVSVVVFLLLTNKSNTHFKCWLTWSPQRWTDSMFRHEGGLRISWPASVCEMSRFLCSVIHIIIYWSRSYRPWDDCCCAHGQIAPLLPCRCAWPQRHEAVTIKVWK